MILKMYWTFFLFIKYDTYLLYAKVLYKHTFTENIQKLKPNVHQQDKMKYIYPMTTIQQ